MSPASPKHNFSLVIRLDATMPARSPNAAIFNMQLARLFKVQGLQLLSCLIIPVSLSFKNHTDKGASPMCPHISEDLSMI